MLSQIGAQEFGGERGKITKRTLMESVSSVHSEEVTMAEKMDPEELQSITSKIADEVLQRVAQTLTTELEGKQGQRQNVFRCPGDFKCGQVYECKNNFSSIVLPPRGL